MEDNTSQEVSLPFYARLGLTLTSIVLILFLVQEGAEILIPLFFALLIAFMVLPLVKWLERRRLPRSAAAIIGLMAFVVVIGSIVYFLIQQMAEFSHDLPTLGDHIKLWISNLRQVISEKYHVDANKQLELLNQGASKAAGAVTDIAQAVVIGMVSFLVHVIFVLVFTFFILQHRALLKKFVIALFSRKHQPRVIDILTETRTLANGYVVGLLLEMVVVAALNCIAFFIFGVKYALLLGVLAAVLNIIPYIGIYTAAGIGAVITLANSTPNHALSVIIILLAVHFVDANVLMPRIVGSRVKMNPLITIIAVLLGALLWGIPGMFLFIPLAGILKIIFERVDGLKPWAILMGTNDEDVKARKKLRK